jgi:imidazoleglycerol-phosphate dehydratase
VSPAGPREAGRPRRRAALRRRSLETEVSLALDLDGPLATQVFELPGRAISSGVGFLDHLLGALARHAGWGLCLRCEGDLVVDEHHSVEDCAITLGEALRACLERGPAARRFAHAYAPLDEALARAVVDLSGRPFCRTELGLGAARLGDLAGENVAHFVESLAASARITIHLEVLVGVNAHHRAEAAFKALALALGEACAPLAGEGGREGRAGGGGRSTKGIVSLEEIPIAPPGPEGGSDGSP